MPVDLRSYLQSSLNRLRQFIEQHTGVLAFAGLLLGIISILMQLLGDVVGPAVRFSASSPVLLRLAEYPDGQQYLTLAAPLIYVNTSSQPTQQAIVESEQVQLQLGAQRLELSGQRVVAIDATKIKSRLLDDRGESRPVLLAPQSVARHTTAFYPLPRGGDTDAEGQPNADFLSRDDWLTALIDQTYLDLTFTARLASGRSLRTACRLPIDADLRIRLIDDGWALAFCAPEA